MKKEKGKYINRKKYKRIHLGFVAFAVFDGFI